MFGQTWSTGTQVVNVVPGSLYQIGLLQAQTTLTAGAMMVMRFWTTAGWSDLDSKKGTIKLALTSLMLSCVIIVLVDSVRRWFNPRQPEVVEGSRTFREF